MEDPEDDFLGLYESVMLSEKRTLSQTKGKNKKIKVGDKLKRGRRIKNSLI